MLRIKKEILNKLKEYAGKMGRDHLGGDDYTSKKKGGLRDFDGYDNVDYNKDMPMDEASRGTIHKAAKKGSYPVSLVVVKDGKVINQVLNIKTPAEVPAAFNVVKNYHKHKGATVHIEDRTGKRLFSESVNEDSPESSHPQGSKKLTNRTTVMDMLDVISHKEFGPDYHKLSTKQKKEVHKLAIKGKLIKQSPFKESVNEILVIVDKFDKRKQDYDKVYYQDGGKRPGDGDINKAKKEFAKLSKKHKDLTLISVGRNSKMYDVMDESVNEGISVSDERHFGKKGIIIMIDDNGKKVAAIFKDKKNADKFNRNKPSDIKKLLQLAKKTKYPKAIDESLNEAGKLAMGIAALTGTRGSAVQDFIDKNRINDKKLFKALKKANLQGRINFASALAGRPGNPNEKLTIKLFGESKKEVIAFRKKAKSETAFYDILDKVERKYGRGVFEKWLDKSLKDLKLNPKKYKTSADKQEALYQAKL